MKKTLLYTAVAALTLGSVTPAIAYDKSRDGHYKGEYHRDKVFKKMDANSDGIITKSEFSLEAEKRFAKMDINGNGEITRDEVKAHRANMKEKQKRDSKQ